MPAWWPAAGATIPTTPLLLPGLLCSLSPWSGPQKLSSLPPWEGHQKPGVRVGLGQRCALAELTLSTLMPTQRPEGERHTSPPSPQVLLIHKLCVRPLMPSVVNDLAGKSLGLLEVHKF